MHSFLKKLIVMAMATEGLNYSWKICSRSATTAERKRVFRISTRAIIIKDENCETNFFLYQEVMIQYVCASENLWMPG